MSRPSTYAEFWGYYLRAHSDPRTRLIHYVGSILSLAALALAVIERQPLWLLAMPVFGYGFAWYAHFLSRATSPPPSDIRCGR